MPYPRHLQAAALAEFLWEPGINAPHIGVTASNGIVTLTGNLPHYLETRGADKAAAARHSGVTPAAGATKANLPAPHTASDGDSAPAALDSIIWKVSVPENAVNFQAAEGRIKLTGQVKWHYRHNAAERAIHGPRGATGISIMITLKPSINVLEIGNDIARALCRSWVNPATIAAGASNVQVTLTGAISNPSRKAHSSRYGAKMAGKAMIGTITL